MSVETTDFLLSFFGWMTVVNFVIYGLTAAAILLLRDWMTGLHMRMFNVEGRAIEPILYAWLGGYKLLIIVFSLVPYIALRIIV